MGRKLSGDGIWQANNLDGARLTASRLLFWQDTGWRAETPTLHQERNAARNLLGVGLCV